MEIDATVGHYLLIHTLAKPRVPEDCSKNYNRLTKDIYDTEGGTRRQRSRPQLILA